MPRKYVRQIECKKWSEDACQTALKGWNENQKKPSQRAL